MITKKVEKMTTIHLFKSYQALQGYVKSKVESEVFTKYYSMEMKGIDQAGNLHILRKVTDEEDGRALYGYRPDSVVIHGLPWPEINDSLPHVGYNAEIRVVL